MNSQMEHKENSHLLIKCDQFSKSKINIIDEKYIDEFCVIKAKLYCLSEDILDKVKTKTGPGEKTNDIIIGKITCIHNY